MKRKNELSGHSKEIAECRYYQEDDKDWEGASYRVAEGITSQESSNRERLRDKFHEMLWSMDFVSAGRILRNTGRVKGSLMNCYVLQIGDSIEEIGQYYKDALILWASGGGVGCNFSALRPKGDLIRGKGGVSSGLVSFIESTDSVAETIESGGSRRAAALALVEVEHPEVMEFIDSKLIHGKLAHHNISVGVNNRFLETVEANGDWTFRFNRRDYGSIKARVVWDKILDNMIKCAEPGLINMSNMMKNNSYYYDPVVSVNPCGEAVLSPYECCCLGSLVLPNFITGSVNTNWKKLESTIKLAVRFLDNVIDVNKYPLKENDIKAHNSRRIGLGVMGLAEYLFMKQIPYGSKKSLVEIEKLMRFIRDCSYQASIELSVEKGAFPKFEPVAYGKASFIRTLPASLRLDVKKYGVRNVSLMAIAPTGTISLLAGVCSGIEPLFSKAYERNDRVSKRIYIHSLYQDILERNEKVPEWLVDSADLKPKDHFDVQTAVQKYTDGAVSKTINLPAGTTRRQLDRLLGEYLYDLKGVTVYVDGSREGQIQNRLTKEQAKAAIHEAQNEQDSDDVNCATGSCDT